MPSFLYEVGEGVARRSYGLNVAKPAGLPKRLLYVAGERSARMELEESRRKVGYLAKAIGGMVGEELEDGLQHVVAGFDQL